MKVLLLGAGAVGSLFGARFAQSGHAVTLVGRPSHVAAVREHGLVVENGNREVVRLAAETEVPAGFAPDAALLTVKTFDLVRAATALAQRCAGPVPTLLPQNGLGAEEEAARTLAREGWREPGRWTVRAVHSVPATLLAPGVVRAAGAGEVLLPDLPAPDPRWEAVDRFERLFRESGFSVRRVGAFDREVWRKVLVNAAINPLSAVRGVPNGRLLRGAAREEAVGLLAEARLAAHYAGFDFDAAETVRDFERVARATARNRSSMLQDLERGRPTEIDAISGALLRIAQDHGVDLPRTRVVAEEVRRRTVGNVPRPQRS